MGEGTVGKKKHKKAQRAAKHGGYDAGGWDAAAQYGYSQDGQHHANPPYGHDDGLLQGLPHMLKSRQSEQFLLGALVGAAAAYVLGDEELRGKLVKTGIKLYSGLMGSVEEMKEQMADLKAEVEAERMGEA